MLGLVGDFGSGPWTFVLSVGRSSIRSSLIDAFRRISENFNISTFFLPHTHTSGSAYLWFEFYN